MPCGADPASLAAARWEFQPSCRLGMPPPPPTVTHAVETASKSLCWIPAWKQSGCGTERRSRGNAAAVCPSCVDLYSGYQSRRRDSKRPDIVSPRRSQSRRPSVTASWELLRPPKAPLQERERPAACSESHGRKEVTRNLSLQQDPATAAATHDQLAPGLLLHVNNRCSTASS